MKRIWTAIASLFLLTGLAMAQSGTVNNLSVNPRQNQEMTNSTGTESGQPSPAVAGSEDLPNGLIPVTTNMAGSSSNGSINQSETGNQTAAAAAKASEHARPDIAVAKPQKRESTR